MKIVTRIISEVSKFHVILKTKPDNAGINTIGWCEIRIPYFMSVEAPIINLNNNYAPYGIPASIKEKFSEGDVKWLKVGERVVEGKTVQNHKWLITEKGRLGLNREISRAVKKYAKEFGLTVDAPKVNLAKEATTSIDTGTAQEQSTSGEKME
jgi:hypothetical protein